MKDAVVTVRLPARTRRRLEVLARREGRSLSGQVERLIEIGLGGVGRALHPPGARPLAGVLRGGLVPTLADFREIRRLVSESLVQRDAVDAGRRR
jgi:hypothetical protein